MSAVRINVGGKEFVASRSTWVKSPVLDMILRRSTEPVPFVDRNPDVFDHILDWLREGKLYIDCPNDYEYGRLCTDADFYGLEDMSRFLTNRINLCSFIYFRSPNGDMTFCDLDAFRALEPADGFIDRLLAGDPAALAQITFVNSDTVFLDMYLIKARNTLEDPQSQWRLSGRAAFIGDLKKFLGSRVTEDTEKPGSYLYNPVPRAKPKS